MTNEAHLRYHAFSRVDPAITALVLASGNAAAIDWRGGGFLSPKEDWRRPAAFEILKFATMLENSPSIGTGEITLRNDPRVLPVGRVLRKTKINELPQLWNVFIGDMSLVGPRPLTPKHFNHYNDTDRQNITVVTPGITGLSALVFRDEEKILSDKADPLAFYRDEIVPIKASLESWYAKHASFQLDILIGFLTVYAILRPGSRLVQYKVETISGIKFPF